MKNWNSVKVLESYATQPPNKILKMSLEVLELMN